jgi:hypothetical protein
VAAYKPGCLLTRGAGLSLFRAADGPLRELERSHRVLELQKESLWKLGRRRWWRERGDGEGMRVRCDLTRRLGGRLRDFTRAMAG